MNRYVYLIICGLIINVSCKPDLPPFPGEAPVRAVYGAPPEEGAERWVQDVHRWGAQAYFYRSEVDTAISPEKIVFTTEMDRARRLYQACVNQNMDFYYGLPIPLPRVNDNESKRLDTTLIAGHLRQMAQTLKTELPELQGIFLWIPDRPQQREVLSAISRWLPSVARSLDEVCRELSIKGIVSTRSDWHTLLSRRQMYQVLNNFPELVILESATWPEENTSLSFWGFIPPQDTQLLQHNPVMVTILTDTEFMGRGRLPAVLPRWWQRMAQATYRPEVRLAAARCFLGDDGATAINFNRLNAHLLLYFLQYPNAEPEVALQEVNQAMFGLDFPSRLSSIMLISEEALEAVTTLNSINILDNSRFPPPAFLDQEYLTAPRKMKAVDDLFEPPGTPLFDEFAAALDTLGPQSQWRWQREVIARPVDEYLLAIEDAVTWLTKIQAEVDFLTLDFPPKRRELFVGGYRDLLLLGRGMYQFVLGAAVYHRWNRLGKSSREEVAQELAPIAEQLQLIADEAEGSSLELQERLRQMAGFFEDPLPAPEILQ